MVFTKLRLGSDYHSGPLYRSVVVDTEHDDERLTTDEMMMIWLLIQHYAHQTLHHAPHPTRQGGGQKLRQEPHYGDQLAALDSLTHVGAH